MHRLNKIDALLISQGCKSIYQNETFERYERRYIIQRQITILKDDLDEIMVPSSLGVITLGLKNTDSDELSECISSNQSSISGFLNDMPDNPSEVFVMVSKHSIPNNLNIICAVAFSEYLHKIEPLYSLKTISDILHNDKLLQISVGGILITRIASGVNDIFSRRELIEKRNDGCSFENAYEVSLTPDDFANLEVSNKGLGEIFNSYKIVLSAIFLLNYSKIDKTEIVGTLCGLKKKEKQRHSIYELSPQNELYRIYEWVYCNRTFSESLEIARNIMSLHFIDGNIYKYDTDTLLSIKSNFSLVSRQCTKDYLETKHQIENQIITTNKAIRDVVTSYQSQLTSLMFILLTLLFTVIITGVISDGKKEIFSTDIVVVFWMFYFVFLLTFIFRTIGEGVAVKKLRDDHISFLDRYKHLIDTGELENYRTQANDIRFRFFTLYRWFWIIFIIIFSGLLVMKTPSNIIELFLK